MDIATITALLGNVKTATEIAKAIKDSGASLEQAELKLKLAELISTLAEVKLEAAGLQEELLAAKREIGRLEEELLRQAALKWRQPCYWLASPGDTGAEEPFCQPCQDNHKRLARLHHDGQGRFTCMVCKTIFRTEERIASDLRAATAPLQTHRTRI